MCVARPTELRAWSDLSARIGRDPLLTQASAGNTSMKVDGRLWVKASGKRLSDALRDDIFVPLKLRDVKNYVREGPQTQCLLPDFADDTLQPSVEAAMHAVLPHKVVAHIHSVNAIAHAVRVDAEEHLTTLLDGLPWAWVPYVASGVPTARRVRDVLERSPEVDVLVLGNHGLVVCGDTCEQVEWMLKEVEIRLGLIPRRGAKVDCGFLEKLADGSKWRLPEDPLLHCLAIDDYSRSILRQGILYPCQFVYLGGREPWQPFYSGLYSEARGSAKLCSDGRPFIVLENQGIFLSNTIARPVLETLIGLAEVVQRIELGVPIRYLTAAECEQAAQAAYPPVNRRKMALSA